VCRLAIFNNMGIKGTWLDMLTLSRGGDGNGFVSSEEIEPRRYKIGKTKDFLVNDLHVKKWFIGENYAYEHAGLEISWLVFHTRYATVGSVDLEHVHPFVVRNENRIVLLMQNGHEPDNIQQLAEETGIFFDGTDYRTMARIIAETGDSWHLTKTRSNWFVFVFEKAENKWYLNVASFRPYDPLHFYGDFKGSFYISSEKLESDQETKTLEGLLRFEVSKEKLKLLV